MPYVKYNANPLGNNDSVDCTVRAISLALNVSWYSVYDDLAYFGRFMGDMPSANRVWKSYLKSMGFKEEQVENTCPACQTVLRFAQQHPQGVYVLSTCEYQVANGTRIATGSHVVTVIDGDYVDIFDSGLDVPLSYFCIRD